jgi:hypothetical protein
VRTKHLDDDDLLEPLPVDDGPPAHVVMVEVVRETIAEVPALRQAAPWSYDAQRQALIVPTTSYLAAFSRMIALHPTQLEHLGEWFETNAVDARMRIVRRLTLGRPRVDPAGTWRMPGELRSPWRARSIPIELVLWPRLDAWTRLSLEPQRGVHVGRRYFRSGHRVLDVLCRRLIGELPNRSVAA